MFTNKVIPFLCCVFFSTVCFSSLDETKEAEKARLLSEWQLGWNARYQDLDKKYPKIGTKIEHQHCFCSQKSVYWHRWYCDKVSEWTSPVEPFHDEDKKHLGRCLDNCNTMEFRWIVDATDIDNNTPLHNARSVKQVRGLLKAGARVYAFKNRVGRNVVEHYVVGAKLIADGKLSNQVPYADMLEELLQEKKELAPEDIWARKHDENDYANRNGCVADLRK